jgi:hypothetical protein
MLFVYFLFIKTVLSYECNENEIYFEKSCYKLIKLDSFENDYSCSNQMNSSVIQCIDYLNKIVNRLIKIYTDNVKFSDLYQFTYLDIKTSRKKIIDKLIENNKQVKNIFLNYYIYDNNHYIENQPSDDEHPNVMMHGSNSGDKCISGERIQNLNESFRFYYEDCLKELPFICVKPYSGNFDLEDKCSHFDKYQPGGRWFECDRLTDDFNVTKSHKCCMYNVKWNENFYDANNLCNKFDSFVFSLRLKGYKLILENYANFLSTNYFDSIHFKDLFSFWTSCKSKPLDSIDSIEKHECLQKNPTAELISSLQQADFKEIQGLKINALNILDNKIYKKSFYNLTFVSLLLNSLKSNLTDDNQYLKLCNKWITSIESNTVNLTDCLYKIWNILDAKTYFLSSRKARSFKIETKTFRSNSIINETQCFYYSNNNETDNKFHLSIPIINVCYHLTIIDFFDSSIVDLKNLNFSNEPNFDSELNYTLSQELYSIILNRLGIANFNECDSNQSNNSSILISNKSCFNLVSMIKLSQNKNDNLLEALKTKNKAVILHSYSLIKNVFHLNCRDTILNINEYIYKCSKYCLFTCPTNCEQDKFIWRYSSNPFVYLNSTSVCLAAYHSNLMSSNNKEHKFYLNNNNNNVNFNPKLIQIKNNNFYSNLWPPFFIASNWNESSNGFYFEQNFDSNESTDFQKYPLVLIQAVYYLNDTIDPIIYYNSDDSNRIEFKYKKILNGSSNTYFNASNDYYDLNFKQISIKFPINIIDDNLIFHSEQIIRLFRQDKQQMIKKIKDSNKCNWFFNTKDSGIKCNLDLNLTFNTYELNDIYNEINIIYPNHTLFKAFTRVILHSNRLLNNSCKNGGLPSNLNSSQCLCFPGFNGSSCEQVCRENSFGTKCQFTCPSNKTCKGLLICNLDPIGCSCASGFKGYECNQSCSIDSWGPNCMFKCNNCTTCDSFSGKCTCPINKEGIECNKCIDGFYGENCTQACASDCLKCDQFGNGNCSIQNNNTINNICLPVNKCSIKTNHYLINEYEFNDSSLICVLKQTNSNDQCEQDYIDYCSFKIYESASKIDECPNYSDLSELSVTV